jgi:hypothetical protein
MPASSDLTRWVRPILVGLVVLDLALAIWGFVFPDTWFSFFHGSSRIDPRALLFRCAANWTGFVVIQVIALARWRVRPVWIAVVAGCRLGDVLTDVTCLVFSESHTVFAWIAFPLAGLGNVVLGVFLLRAFDRITQPGG